jgi:hypothetical protein
MTTNTVPERAPSPDDLRAHAQRRQQADVRLALLIADAHLFTRLLGNGWGREDCEALAGNLWMVGEPDAALPSSDGASDLARNLLARVEQLEAQLDQMAVEVVTRRVRIEGTASPFDEDEHLVPSIVLSADGSATINLSSGSDDEPFVRLTAGREAGEVFVGADFDDEAPTGMLCAAAGIGEGDRGRATLTFGDARNVVEVAAWPHVNGMVAA